MSYSIIPTIKFIKEAKKLKKKYGSLKDELLVLEAILAENPDSGTALGNNTYKIRIAIKSKGKGKSGGARIITYKVVENLEVYLLTIYDKSELNNIEDKIISKIIADIITDSSR